jgi:hypothetical protein
MEGGVKARNSSSDSHHPWLPIRRFQENRIDMVKKRKPIAIQFCELGTEIFQTTEVSKIEQIQQVSKMTANRETSTGP